MSNNFEGWKHINTAPKDREILVWDGRDRFIAKWFNDDDWISFNHICHPTHWRGCPPPPVEEDEE